MLTKIKSLLGNPPDTPAHTERMPPDEGMRYRRDMLYQSVRESMLALQVLSSLYKFKVVNVDQQTFILMLEVSKLFCARWNGAPASFAQIEQRMITGAMNRAGVTLQAVFWRIDETVEAFDMPTRAGDGSNTSGVAARRREVPGDVSHARLRRPPAVVPAVDNEGATPGTPTPPVGNEIGGTQYGQL